VGEWWERGRTKTKTTDDAGKMLEPFVEMRSETQGARGESGTPHLRRVATSRAVPPPPAEPSGPTCAGRERGPLSLLLPFHPPAVSKSLLDLAFNNLFSIYIIMIVIFFLL
jgi:hypothetical protein